MTQQEQPKHILFVENGIGYGGAIICLRHLVRNLNRSQYLPMVVTGRTGPQYREIADEALWKHIPDKLIDIISLQRKMASLTWPDKVPGLRYFTNQLLARLDDLCNFLPFFIRLLWTAWRFKTDLIHANNEPLCNRAALLVAKCLNIPSVCHVRGDQTGSRLMRWAYSLPNHFISVSNWVADSMCNKLDIQRDKISVVYDGIALEKLNINADGNAFREQFNIPVDAFAVGLVGLLIPWKGQELFLDAAKLLKDQIPNLKMPIIGGTPDDCIDYENKLKSRVLNESLQEIVFFTGHLSRMENAYNALDIVVSASTNPEPLGTMVIECMGMGKLLLGPDHGGAAEMITHEKTGLLFEPKSAESLAENILKVFNNRSFIPHLGKAAREVALTKFDVSHHTAQIMKIYRSLIN